MIESHIRIPMHGYRFPNIKNASQGKMWCVFQEIETEDNILSKLWVWIQIFKNIQGEMQRL